MSGSLGLATTRDELDTPTVWVYVVPNEPLSLSALHVPRQPRDQTRWNGHPSLSVAFSLNVENETVVRAFDVANTKGGRFVKSQPAIGKESQYQLRPNCQTWAASRRSEELLKLLTKGPRSQLSEEACSRVRTVSRPRCRGEWLPLRQ